MGVEKEKFMTEVIRLTNNNIALSENLIRVGNSVIFTIDDVTVISTTSFSYTLGSDNIFKRIHENLSKDDRDIEEGDRYGEPCKITWLDKNSGLFLREEGGSFGDPMRITIVANIC